ncbi:hypothetical protein [Ruminococcus flavefaciens]|uniref:hypothetical protein n=1 Tax=Ruminococcus flavefaciens TaxID=1265 RepID=UPI0026EE8AD8|nr:hypothetical protein [Ruminococcus flavefaciens]
MNGIDLTDFFKGIVDSEEGPIVICNLDYRIVYVNPKADVYYEPVKPLAGRLLATLMDEEMMSKVVMSVEWFKEDVKNNKVFALHDKVNNMDMYILSIRNSKKELIGFYGRREDRTPEQGKEFDLD